MAVYAAHLTRTLEGRPSIFQATAQEALGNTVKPALKKVFEYLADAYPNKFDWSLRWYDELYLVLDACLQYHYLKHYAGSFSESFYGLIRVPISASSEFDLGQRLPDALEKGSLLLLVLLPYFRDKIEAKVERWREMDEDGLLGKNYPDRLRKAAIKVYTIVHMASELARLVCICGYVTEKTGAFSPSFALLGLTLKEAPVPDEEEYSWSDLVKSVFTGDMGSIALTFPMFGSALLRGAEYMAFGVQFLRWWHAKAPPTSALPVPKPPEKGEVSQRLINKCPVCLQTWRTPTVLPVSGYVFCYGCISRHLKTNKACPVTRYPATSESLIRLYVD